MKPTKISTLVLWCLGSLVVCGGLSRIAVSAGITVPTTPWLTGAVILTFALYLVLSGLPIRARLHGTKKEPIDALAAARLVRMVKASSLGGAVLAGLYGSQLVLALAMWSIEAQRAKGLWGAATALCAIVLVIAALVVEKWCTLPPDEFGGEDAELEGAA
ncbi:DUF3180 domain-containing protein [Micrococcales bacterium 31B]|nr:DUF3180 domain-containing protein [Micrococcales bacterium 31B]